MVIKSNQMLGQDLHIGSRCKAIALSKTVGIMDKSELEELEVSIYEKLRRATRAGDKKKALGLLDEIYHNRNTYRDIFLTWIDILQTYGADRLDEDFVYETNRLLAERVIWPAFEGKYGPETNGEDRLKQRAYVWTSLHGINIEEIEEDEEKFIIKLKCPTGGSIRSKEQYGKTKEAHPWSYGQEGICYYCTHCPITLELMLIEKIGYPPQISLPQPEGRCTQYIYKDPESVPEEYYKRIGKKKKTG